MTFLSCYNCRKKKKFLPRICDNLFKAFALGDECLSRFQEHKQDQTPLHKFQEAPDTNILPLKTIDIFSNSTE